jgi:uncharacterized Tic20 family protein
MSENQMPPAQTPPPTQPASTPPGSNESQARMWNMLCHLSALAICIPFGNIIGPLVIWQIKKNEFPSVNVHGKAALNFQITVTIVCVVGWIVATILTFIRIGFLLYPVVMLVALAGLVFAIIAGIKANNGEDYKYPFSFQIIK